MEPISNRPGIQKIKSADKRKKVCEALESLRFTENDVKQMMKVFEEQIDYANSLNEEDRKKSDLFWECTYVSDLVKGNENGRYLGLDLGSTNFRVVLVDLKDGVAKTTTKYYNLTDDQLSGPAELVFDHIAASMETFITEEKIQSQKPIGVGFTFSFPTVQKTLKKSILVTWTKRFKCTNGPGLDPCILLEEAIERRGGVSVPVNVMARISDTTGTLMAGSYYDKKCAIGLILGSGSNACYVEHLKNFKKLDPKEAKSDKILVNCEWGAFGDNGCLDFCRNEFEREVDQYSNFPGSYTFEKSFGGFYLGEMFRVVLVKLTKAGVLFDGKGSDELMTRWLWKSRQVTTVEKDNPGSSENTMSVLKDMKLDTIATEEDVLLVQEACYLMSQRAAYIVATALAVLLNHINEPEVSIGIDGSLYEHHPRFHDHMTALLQKLVPSTKFRLFLVKDGSGQGAALVAAVESS
ncbi:hexokinase type 2-like [Mytilus edulis]|uniref:hexokinase type 2-like n=1 Tax=Mytilus edulis TaxID=6550 RepID=UPI0039F11CF4